MLNETDQSVSEIGERVGFEDITSFGRAFKKVAYCSPLKYRKNNEHVQDC